MPQQEQMIVCYGCKYPMHYAFASYCRPHGNYPYCLHCEFWRRLKGLSPGEHDPGTVSNGSLTMRRRKKAE